MSDRAARNRAWQHFWAAERTESCVPESPATGDRINDHWQRFFTGLPNGNRVLDVATGNGALLRQAAAVVGNGHLDMLGVDLAAIDPLQHAPDDAMQEANVRFMGGIDAASLPFDDSSFDVVVSQYGLEYAQLERALAEIERVLSPEGRLRWLAHCADSAVVRQNADQNRQVDCLLERNGAVDAMSQLVERILRQKSVKIAMSRLGRAMRAAESFCRENPPAGIVTEVCRGFADTANRWQAYAPGDLKAMVEHAKRELIAHRQRILDLNDAVVTEEREALIRRRLAVPVWSSARIETLTAGQGDESIGLLIVAQRSSGA